MNLTVYLPDELGRWAKESGMNLSAALRERVEEEKASREAVAATLEKAEVHELDVVDPDAGWCKMRVHGTLIADPGGGVDAILVFLGRDGKVYVYDGSLNEPVLHEDVNPDDLRDWIDPDPLYFDAMRALGRQPVIDVGLPDGAR